MSKTSSRFISDLDDYIAALFAPAISEGQELICYLDEEMTPYQIQGDNIITSSSYE